MQVLEILRRFTLLAWIRNYYDFCFLTVCDAIAENQSRPVDPATSPVVGGAVPPAPEAKGDDDDMVVVTMAMVLANQWRCCCKRK